MNEMKPEDVMRALDILDKMDFFQGQRAGRELWNDKPYEVQEQDIADFSQGIATIKKVIEDALDLIDRLQILNTELLFGVARIRAEAITEFAERLMKAINPDYPISFEQVNRIAEEMKQGHKAAAIDLQHEQTRLTAALQSAAMAVMNRKDGEENDNEN